MLILQVLLLIAVTCHHINTGAAPQHSPLENGEPDVWDEYIVQVIFGNTLHVEDSTPFDGVPDTFNKEQLLESPGKLTQGPGEGTAGTFPVLWISIGVGIVLLLLGLTAFIFRQRWRQNEAEARRLHPIVNHGFNGDDEISPPPGRAGLMWNISSTPLDEVDQSHFPLPEIYHITPNHRLIKFVAPDSVWIGTSGGTEHKEILRRLPLYPLHFERGRDGDLPSIFKILITPVDKTSLRNYHLVMPSPQRRWSLGSADALVKSTESPYYQWPDAAKFPESPYYDGPEIVPRYYGSGIKKSCSEEQLSNLQK